MGRLVRTWILHGGRLLFVFVAGLALCGEAVQAQEAETPQQLVAWGDRMLEEGDPAEAEGAYQRALRLDDDLLAAYIGLARVALEEEAWRAAGSWADEVLRRDPESLEAHYYRAISHREQAKFRTVTQRIHWTGAARHFERIIEQDSLYRDVLYQYALLRSYHEAFDRAIALGEAQTRLRPELEEPWQGLFRIYRRFLHFTRPQKALAWLEGHDSEYAAFFTGEVLRREEKLAQADSVYAALLARPLRMPRQPVLLARARVHYALDEPDAAQRFVGQAIEGIEDRLAAALVLEDFKYLLTDEELAQYRALETPAAHRAFFRAFWAKRDPMPARRLNVRMEGHYRRLRKAEQDYAFYSVRSWLNNPDRLGELDFTAAYDLNREFNDRGLIYIRHGEPDDRVTAVSGGAPVNESWRYYGDPPLDFHFTKVADGQADDGWRLTPRPVLANRDMWGGDYAHRARSRLEAIETGNRIAEASRKYVQRGLSTDRHTWPDDVEPLDFPHMLAAFRGEDGQVWLEVHYTIPADEIAKEGADSLRLLDVEVGYALHDTAWTPRGGDLIVKQLPAGLADTAATDFFRLAVPPDSYHVALHSRPLQQAHLLGGYKLSTRLPDFGRPGLNMSDLLPARSVQPASAPSRFNRGALHVVPHPGAAFSVQEPVHVYFELYDLARGADGQTRFLIEYILTPEKGRRGLSRLFGGGDRPVLTLKTSRSGPEAAPVEHAEIDVTRVDPGRYTLTVRVTDEQGGTTVARSRTITLTR